MILSHNTRKLKMMTTMQKMNLYLLLLQLQINRRLRPYTLYNATKKRTSTAIWSFCAYYGVTKGRYLYVIKVASNK